MADVGFNIAKGRAVHYATLPATNDALIVVILQATGLQADATLIDHDDLSALLAASNDEPTNAGYARKTVSASVTVTVDDTNERVDVDVPDQVWTAVAAGTGWAKLLFCYDADTTTGTDVNVVPISAHDFVITPDGSDITGQIAAAGFYRAA